MKLGANTLVVVAMVVGAVGAMGCKSQPQDKISDKGNDVAVSDSNAATPEDNPAAAPVAPEGVDGSKPGVEQDWYGGYRYWSYSAPPAVRYERVGAYRSGYFWRPGYYGWGGRSYTWYPGTYYPERVGYRYVNPGWYSVGSRWGYRGGYWVRR
jgi:hypothetical protein